MDNQTIPASADRQPSSDVGDDGAAHPDLLDAGQRLARLITEAHDIRRLLKPGFGFEAMDPGEFEDVFDPAMGGAIDRLLDALTSVHGCLGEAAEH